MEREPIFFLKEQKCNIPIYVLFAGFTISDVHKMPATPDCANLSADNQNIHSSFFFFALQNVLIHAASSLTVGSGAFRFQIPSGFAL